MANDHMSVGSRQLKFPLSWVGGPFLGVDGFRFAFLFRRVGGRAPCGVDVCGGSDEICMGRPVWRWGGRCASCEL
jgi:hypothetical protein